MLPLWMTPEAGAGRDTELLAFFLTTRWTREQVALRKEETAIQEGR